MPALSVVLSTRNRGASLLPCLRSLLATDDAAVEVLVVDQSDDDATENAVRPLLGDARLRYHRSATRGLAAARNAGVGLTQAPLLAMTDDDCEVDADWTRELRRAFEDPRIALLFGSVKAAPHDATLGCIPACSVAAEFVARRVADKARLDGMGACMAFRRQLWLTLRGFDELLGSGARFRAADETDFCLRGLLAGHAVCVTPRVGVLHHGFRPHREGAQLAFGYWHGTGASFAKLLKCGHLSLIGLLARLAWRFLVEPSPIARSLTRTSRLSRLYAFLSGAWAASRLPVDSAGQGVFHVREAWSPSESGFDRA